MMDNATMNASALRVLIEVNSCDLRMGAVNDALDLAELAHPSGASFMLCGACSPDFQAAAESRGISVVGGRSRSFSRLGLPLYLASVLLWIARLKQLRPHVVHLNYPGYGPSLACAAWLCGIPIVSRAGGPYIAGNLSNRWIAAYAANCAAHASELLASPLADKVVITGDLFRPDRVRTTLNATRPLPPRQDGLARLVFLGQLVERKGLHVLIEAFALLRQPAELLLVGGDWSAPGYPASLKAMARTAGVDARIIFENHRDDVGALLSTADVFVLPSFSEGRPRSIIEAMSLGAAIVATDAGGIPTLVEDDCTGLLVPPGNAEALAAALDRVIASPALRRRLGKAARARAEQDCRADRTALEYLRLYYRLIAA
jgi:glycosyltransferase involved in cell wall biosynthesis